MPFATAEIFLLLLSKLELEHGIKDLASARNFQFLEPKQNEKPATSTMLGPLVSGL